MLTTRGFPDDDYPSGWFQVAWSSEVPVGGVVPLRYFGTDLVLYRGESGTAQILDAYCPHLGAHLGHGGSVSDDAIVCPFHGWKWSQDGQCVDIPYSQHLNQSRSLRAWPVAEASGLVLVWYDRNGAAPTWDPEDIPEYRDPDYFTPFEIGAVRTWPGVRLHPQTVAENAVDTAHQQFVHGAATPGMIVSSEVSGPILRVRQELTFGLGKKSTWLTPGGQVKAYLDAEVMGVGLGAARFLGTDGAVHLQSTTPVDEETSDIRISVFVKRGAAEGDEPDETSRRRLEFELRQVENDLVIWEHMIYQAQPAYAREEAKEYAAFRKWSQQFYPEREVHVDLAAATTAARPRAAAAN